MKIGELNTMIALRQTSVGIFLGNDEGDEVLLPMKYIPQELQIDDSIEVFIYTDSEDRPIATNLTPTLMVGDFGYMMVKEQTQIGAFLDWGLEKDLLLPYREQSQNITEGRYVLVYVYLDETTNRVAATTKTKKYISRDTSELEVGQKVDVLIAHKTDLGVSVIVNNSFEGLVYANEIYKIIKPGDRIEGYINNIRDDGKLDIRLQASGVEALSEIEAQVLEVLKEAGGRLPVGDKSDPEMIYSVFEMSKKNFKKAAGILYKKGIVQIEQKSIEILEEQ